MKTCASILGLVLMIASATGCQRPVESSGQSGGVQLGLDLSSGATLSQATYTITGPAGFMRSVTVSLGTSPKLSTFIGGTPPGKGYVLSVTGIASDGLSICAGISYPFDVVAGKTTNVSLALRCHEPEKTGSIQTNGAVNFCAAIDSLTASRTMLSVGETTDLASTTHDTDGLPGPITFAWTATSGSFDNPRTANPHFTCTAPGGATLTLTVSDGDCGKSASLMVSCFVVGAPVDGGAVPDSATAPPAATLIAPPDAGAAAGPPAPDARTSAADLRPDPCLACESSSPEPACASRYNACITMPGQALNGPSAGSPRNRLCTDALACVHATRCDKGGSLRDCFCGHWVDEFTCQTSATGLCKDAFYAAAESTSNVTVMKRLSDLAFAAGVAASLVEGCEEQPEPLCGPWCGYGF